MFKLAELEKYQFGPHYLAKQMRKAIEDAQNGSPWPMTKLASLLILHTVNCVPLQSYLNYQLVKCGAVDDALVQDVCDNYIRSYQRIFDVDRDTAEQLILKDLRQFCPEIIYQVELRQLKMAQAQAPASQTGESTAQTQTQPATQPPDQSGQTGQAPPAETINAAPVLTAPSFLASAQYILESKEVNPSVRTGFIAGIPLLLIGLYGLLTGTLKNYAPLLLIGGLLLSGAPTIYYATEYPDKIVQHMQEKERKKQEQQQQMLQNQTAPPTASSPAAPMMPPTSEEPVLPIPIGSGEPLFQLRINSNASYINPQLQRNVLARIESQPSTSQRLSPVQERNPDILSLAKYEKPKQEPVSKLPSISSLEPSTPRQPDTYA